MKVLFTGSSSFTGLWFIKSLTAAGHEVVATFGGSAGNYQDIRARRVAEVRKTCRAEFEAPFGSDRFLDVLSSKKSWDLLCHHAADVTNYKSADFDVVRAVQKNTNNITGVFAALKGCGCSRVLLTGSIFEQNEGVGSDEMRAFSPYGLSKGLTSETFRFYAREKGMSLGKFVIPNPFGPYEEPRFTTYLVRSWCEGKTPQVSTPAYVRDNIHVSLLARSYVWFAESMDGKPGLQKLNPSGYPESQGTFAKRFAEEMGARLGFPCRLVVAEQREYPEPMVRINTDMVAPLFPDWNEKGAWDELAEYYRKALITG